MFLISAGSLLNVMAAEYLKVPVSLGTSIGNLSTDVF
jgi:hypothetical protein